MRPTRKILPFSSVLVYLNTKNDQLNVIKTIRNLCWHNSHIWTRQRAKFQSKDAKIGGFMTF